MSKNFELMQQGGAEFATVSAKPLAPVVPAIKEHSRDNRHHDSVDDEALKLVQQIFLLQTEQPPRVVVFAGVDHGNGCSRICRAVAEVLAKTSRKPVCLVEANLRSPGLPALFGTTNHHGLTDSLLNEGSILSFAKSVSDNLFLLSSGALAADSAKLLTSQRLKTRITELRAEFDFVIIDAPPLSRYADAVAVGASTDGFVLIVEAEFTRRKAALTIADNLRSSNIPILGAVLNKRTFPIPEKIYNRL
jgi:capsular exopolysaccharide synthesis family protein